MKDFELENIDRSHDDFLRDESKKIGSACSISFPRTEAEAAATLSYMSRNGVGVTVQGARTGVAAGAVPSGGHILSMGRMDRVTGLAFDEACGSFLVTLQPGVVLSKLREMLDGKRFDTAGWSEASLEALEAFRKAGDWFFPTDPTETSATLGGIAACNSSGACSFHYGPARRYIAGLDVVLADGSILRLRRSEGASSWDGDSYPLLRDGSVLLKGHTESTDLHEGSAFSADDDSGDGSSLSRDGYALLKDHTESTDLHEGSAFPADGDSGDGSSLSRDGYALLKDHTENADSQESSALPADGDSGDSSPHWGDGSAKTDFELTSTDGKLFQVKLPGYKMPGVKNAAGYFTCEGMDPIDLFIGGEGTLGVITGVTLRLIPRPACIWGFTALLNEEAQALDFVGRLRASALKDRREPRRPVIAALEFFNRDALKLIRRFKQEGGAFAAMPDAPEEAASAVYVEIHAENEDDACDMVMKTTEILENCGGSGDASWFADNAREMEKLHAFRHAVPEAVNLVIADRKKTNPSITKLGTDMAVPDERLAEAMEMYNRDLEAAGLESVIFGHIGDNHLHVNILPRSAAEYEKGWELYHNWARRIIGMGGTISAEHGVGKLKTALLAKMYGPEGILQMKTVKKVFDPQFLLNPGDLFPEER